MSRFFQHLLVLVLAGPVFSCSGVIAVGSPPADRAYYRALSEWTRHGEVYEHFEGRLFVRATLLSPSYRLAWVKWWSDTEGLTPKERADELGRQEEEAEKYWDLVLAVYTGQFRWNDLDRPDTAWRLYLKEGVIIHSLVEIERLDERRPDLLKAFPERSRFYRLYRIRFPRAEYSGDHKQCPEEGCKLILSIKGPPANMDLSWNVP